MKCTVLVLRACNEAYLLGNQAAVTVQFPLHLVYSPCCSDYEDDEVYRLSAKKLALLKRKLQLSAALKTLHALILQSKEWGLDFTWIQIRPSRKKRILFRPSREIKTGSGSYLILP